MNLIKPVYAAPTPKPIGDLCSGGGLGPFAEALCKLLPTAGNETNNAKLAFGAFAFLISNVIGIMVMVAGVWFIIQFLLGGFSWLSSGGDKGKLEKAQQTLLHAVIGLVIVLSAYALISLISAVLGVDLLLNNPGAFVDRLKP